MKVETTLIGRLKQTFNLIFGDLATYLLSVLGVVSLWVVIIALGIIILTAWWSTSSGILFILGIIIAALGLWVAYSGVFLTSFIVTKSKLTDKSITWTDAVKYALKNLWNKAIVDFWYFVVLLWIALLWVPGGLLVALLIKYGSVSFQTIGIGLFVFYAVVVSIYYLIKFYFGSYHCFEKEKFNWANFKESAQIVKWKFWQVLGNLAVVIILVAVLWRIIEVALRDIFGISPIANYATITGLSVGAIIGGILILLIRMILNQIPIVYSYIYYKFLSNTSVEEETQEGSDEEQSEESN